MTLGGDGEEQNSQDKRKNAFSVNAKDTNRDQSNGSYEYDSKPDR